MSAKTSGHIRKYLRKHKFKKASVLRVLATVMENQAAAAAKKAPGNINDPNSDYHNEFFSTGRIGRRNALPDILGYNCTTTTADLPLRLSALTTNDTPSTSSVSSSSSTGPDGNIASTSSSSSSSSSAVSSCSSSTQPVGGESMNAT